jgi:hypothetical protein
MKGKYFNDNRRFFALPSVHEAGLSEGGGGFF